MANRISVKADGFADAVHNALEEYFDDVASETLEIVEDVAIDTAKELEAKSPSDRGDYAKGWYIKPLKKNKKSSMVEIGNKHYQLTHLLEHGHIKVVHGKVLGFTDAKPHIGKAEKNAIKTLTERIERSIQK